ncbi:MAG: GntR family transcriptional regulator [Desulfobacterales bacterium]|nr:MAG: GntR family transcriptional regulator [Desulfobacterales bacterium]
MAPDILPRYYQIKEIIKKWIVEKEFDSGDKIPSENELAAKFNVSRLTVRQAISQLTQEGFLRTRRGAGTFVADDEELINSYKIEFSGFMDDLFYLASRSTTKSAEIDRIKTPKRIKSKLQLSDADNKIIQIKRVRYIRDRSFAYTINYIPIDIGKKIKKAALLQKPLLQILEQDLGVQFTEAFQTMGASFADQELAEKLNIPSGSPILSVERTMYIKKQVPFELVQSFYRGDLYRYVTRLKPVRRKRGSFWVQQGDYRRPK